MKQTFLHDNHVRRGGKMVEFAGHKLPVWFSDLKTEHMAVRENVGAFDISHMGVLKFSGPNTQDFLQKISCNDIQKADGKMIYSMILNESGGILDDIMVGMLGDRGVMVVNAANLAKLTAWFEQVGHEGVEIERCDGSHGFLAIQGPNSLSKVDESLGLNLQETAAFSVWEEDVKGVPCTIMRTGYTGETGVELVVPKESIEMIWDLLIDGGIIPCGLGARDTLRLETGLPLYGQELSEKIHPLMTRYKWVLKFDTEFVGKSALEAIKDEPQEWATVGLEVIGKGIPRSHYPIKEGGEVTSGTMSPSLNKAIAMALVKPEYAEIGTEVTVDCRGREVLARVTKVPFLSKK